MKPEFYNAVAGELNEGEKVRWEGYPDAQVLRASLMAHTILWMSGLFMFGAGLIRSAPDDLHVLYGLIIVLVIIATAGAIEMILVARRADQTMYLITDRRLISICTVQRSGEREGGSYAGRTLRNQTKSSPSFFLMSNIPAQIFFLILLKDVIDSFAKSFDVFIALGFALTAFAWLQTWFQDMRLPLPRFRDLPRSLYEMADCLVFVESVDFGDVGSISFKGGRDKTINCFIVSTKDGCMRLRAIHDGEAMKTMLEKRT